MDTENSGKPCLSWLWFTALDCDRQKNNRSKSGCGARSRNRTGTAGLGPTDFKSVVSTYFTTRAQTVLY